MAPTPEELLSKVKSEIADFESRKPGQLRSDLDGFIKKRDALLKDYADQYPALLEQWRAQDAEIRNDRATLRCRYPDDAWKASLGGAIRKACIGMKEAVEAIEIREKQCRGPLEKARDDAKAVAAVAEARLQDLQKNAALSKAHLADQQKRLAALGAEIGAPKGARALAALWLDILPEHRRLAPPDADLDYCKGESPREIEDAWFPPDPSDPDGSLPKLIPPQSFGEKLDAAWTALDEARRAYGAAEGAFAAKPDDLATLRANLAAQLARRSDVILATLAAAPAPRPTEVAPKDPPAHAPQPPSPASAPQPQAPPAEQPGAGGGGSTPESDEGASPKQSSVEPETREAGVGAGTATAEASPHPDHTPA